VDIFGDVLRVESRARFLNALVAEVGGEDLDRDVLRLVSRKLDEGHCDGVASSPVEQPNVQILMGSSGVRCSTTRGKILSFKTAKVSGLRKKLVTLIRMS